MIRFRHWLVGATAATFAFGSLGCTAADTSPPERSWPEIEQPEYETQPEGSSPNDVFSQASFEYDVPVELLKALAWVESRGQMVAGHEHAEGLPPAYGMMGLRGERLYEAAEIVGAQPELAASDLTTNIRAGAALLSKLAELAGIARSNLAAWAPVVASYSNIELPQGQSHYVHQEVYAALRSGLTTETLAFEPIGVEGDFPSEPEFRAAGPDYAASVWRPSPTYGSRVSGSKGGRQMVIIHTCEGAYSGCWSHLTKSSSKVSAHYVVNSTGSEISQLVKEANRAYHIGATYKCSLNSNTKCALNGTGSNQFTVGVEHAGYGSQTSWDSGQLNASAKLVCDITRDNGIPIDANHIVAHGRLQPYNRTDPGKSWPWQSYINLVKSHCNAGGGGGTGGSGGTGGTGGSGGTGGGGTAPGAVSIVVDSNASKNGPNAKFEASSSWTASTSVSGYYNTGYFWRSTGSTSDPASFKVNVPSAQTLVVEAWWPSATDRSPSAPFMIYDASGKLLASVKVDQRKNGGGWVKLGTFALTAGWNTIALSRWTATGSVVVADAVRVRSP
jgi:hypothetical protein